MVERQYFELADVIIDLSNYTDISHIKRYIAAFEVSEQIYLDDPQRLMLPIREGIKMFFEDVASAKISDPVNFYSDIDEVDVSVSGYHGSPLTLRKKTYAGEIIINAGEIHLYRLDITIYQDTTRTEPSATIYAKYKNTDIYKPIEYTRSSTSLMIPYYLISSSYGFKVEDDIVYVSYAVLPREISSSYGKWITIYDDRHQMRVLNVYGDGEYIYSEPIEGPVNILGVAYEVTANTRLIFRAGVSSMSLKPIISIRRYEKARIAFKKPRVYIV